MSELPEAPYIFIYDEVNVDGKQVKVFRLGKFGKEKLKNAVDKETFHSRIRGLEDIIYGLVEIIGRDRIIEHFKQKFLESIRASAKHRSDLVAMPFWFEKDNALGKLLVEKKIFYSPKGGWLKLGEG